ncbi:flagellar hook-associated protein [Ketogulonicigenium robustum]|uniref:Flagellar hook-associated protein 1 n=1 Tax=Ketogulonicigenium robustum TaxID=92947 RepID=A0A1W6P1V3_9RHOB|nr:flagellar hook-associated protein FlgK [Ketogulonicigenium robustum]ARO15429.1 flagellar hook-associated protein [Ketogulonicigenium robustum]
MSLSYSLGNALSGLAAVSRQTEVISSNVSNALTVGYARRDVALSANSIGGRGAGVSIDGVSRAVNAAITADRRNALTRMDGSTVLAQGLARLEVALGAPTDVGSIAGRITAFEQALVTAASDPTSQAGLDAAAYALSDIVKTLNDNAAKVQTMRAEADADIAGQVDSLNTALQQVATLNKQITRALTSGADAAGLMDQRAMVIDSIAAIIPVSEVARDNGVVALMAPGGVMLVENSAATFGFTHSPTITADMSLQNGLLSGLTVDGRPLAADGGVGKLAGGTLGAVFALRDDVLTSAQAGLDDVAADLALRFQNAANDPTIGASGPLLGLLTDSGAAVNPADTVGLASRLRMNSLIDPGAGGDATLLRDGLYTMGGTSSGSSVQLARWSAALSASQTLPSGTLAKSAASSAAHVLNDVSAARVSADNDVSFTSALHSSLFSAEAVSGVDSDQEMQKLLLIETAYAANAKVIQAVDGMLKTLLEI